MKRLPVILGAAALAGLLPAIALAAGDSTRGQSLYESRCIACHSPDAHRVGPRHRGVFGREAGSADGYTYSPALRASRVIWDEVSLDAWLSDPESVIPGQRMGYRTGSPADRRDLIAYLRSLSE